jgi:hypothetical protein
LATDDENARGAAAANREEDSMVIDDAKVLQAIADEIERARTENRYLAPEKVNRPRPGDRADMRRGRDRGGHGQDMR